MSLRLFRKSHAVLFFVDGLLPFLFHRQSQQKADLGWVAGSSFHRYVADVLADFRTLKGQGTKEAVQSKLLFKKRMFRETDESITEPMFINLSYVQAQHDYLQGNYPVGRDDAAQLAALQMQVRSQLPW